MFVGFKHCMIVCFFLFTGIEALAKVPEEFVIQKNTNANPPTFFLTLEYILRHHKAELTSERLTNLERLYPRLQVRKKNEIILS